MTSRPAFFVYENPVAPVICTRDTEFIWFSGMALCQKQKSIAAWHDALRQRYPNRNILEISSKSPLLLGQSLSAFHLTLPLRASDAEKADREICVEALYQSCKVFEKGGPYKEIRKLNGSEAKRYPLLTQSGALTGFHFDGESWPLLPRSAFYDWLYVQALHAHPALAQALTAYDTFTDIEFNPKKSQSCQAASAALFVALQQSSLLEEALSSRSAFLAVLQHCHFVRL